MAEVFEVLAVVEDVEEFLGLVGAKEVGTETGAASDHLPEFSARSDELEKHQIHHFGNVDARVEHIDGDGDVGGFFGIGEVVDETLGVGGFVGDEAGELAFVVGIVDVEAIVDEFGVIVVFGEDDGFAETVAACDFLATGHEVGQGFVYGVNVEEPLIQGGGFDPIGRIPILIPVQFIPIGLLRF